MKRAFEGGGLWGAPRQCRPGAVYRFCGRYHREWNHQALDNKIIEPEFSLEEKGEMQCRQRLGGLLRYYYRDAA